MKKLLSLLAIVLVGILFSGKSMAQTGAPAGITFQGIATDASGNIAMNATVFVKDAIIQTSATGTTLYSESFSNLKTTEDGVFTITIGQGTKISTGTFSAINWSNGPYFLNLQVAIKPAKCASNWTPTYYSMGTQQFWSVPYALNAGSVPGLSALIDDTASLAARIAGHTTQINALVVDSATLINRFSKKVNVSDTSSMLLGYKTFYPRHAISLTTTGSSGAATYTAATGVLNIPNYAGGSGGSGTVTSIATNTGSGITGGAITSSGTIAADTSILATKLWRQKGIDSVSANVNLRVKYTDTSNMLSNYLTGINNAVKYADSTVKYVTPTQLAGISGVPYTGATKAVDLGNYDLTVNGMTVGLGAGSNNSRNSAIGYSSLVNNTTGIYNTAYGANSLQSNTTGYNNTAIGNGSLQANTTGLNNTANGTNSLESNTTGSFNSSNGMGTLYLNTTGSNNTANGHQSLRSNTTGDLNSANGAGALYSNTTGNNNTANGINSLFSNNIGSNNTASGSSALFSNTTGLYNTAIGYNADVSKDGLSNATAIGNGAIVTGSNHIQLGNGSIDTVFTTGKLQLGAITYPNTDSTSGLVLTTNGSGVVSWATASGGSVITTKTKTLPNPFDFVTTPYSGGALDVSSAQNLANGVNVLTTNTSGIANVGFGINVLSSNTAGTANTAVGFKSLYSNTTGYVNTAVGAYALYNNTTGKFNTAIGSSSLISNTTGSNNTAVGEVSLLSNTTGDENTAYGVNALLANTTGSFNSAFGAGSLDSNTTGSFNSAFGHEALWYNTTGSNNTANGHSSLFNNTIGSLNSAYGAGSLVSNTTGSNNTANGINSLFSNTTGSSNTANGSSSLYYNTLGYKNTAMGDSSLVTNINGSNNTALGYNADVNSAALTNATAIGYGAKVTGSNHIQLGNGSIDTVFTSGSLSASGASLSGNLIAATNSNGQSGIGTATPDASAKLDVSSTIQGFLPPRMTAAQRDAIANPAKGLMIYCTDCGDGEPEFYNNKSVWVNLIGGASAPGPVGSSYQGGIVFYILQPSDPGYVAGQTHGLIAATSDQSAGIQWYNGSFTVTGATGTAIGSGVANTNAIIANQGATSTNYAAGLARAYTGGGYTDWYLPSKDELRLMYMNIGQGASSPNYNIGAFAGSYWSSSELDYTVAWSQPFANGNQLLNAKLLTFYVRAIRAF